MGPSISNKIFNFGSSDDYALLELDEYDFYYGYETEDSESGEWYFVVTKDESETVLLKATSELDEIGNRNGEELEPKDYLLIGIGYFINKL
jgi:hypothetical protein